jgi:hypothetical protein
MHLLANASISVILDSQKFCDSHCDHVLHCPRPRGAFTGILQTLRGCGTAGARCVNLGMLEF